MTLALGTAQFGLNYGIANRSGQLSDAESAAVIDLARVAGIDTLDTAAGYGTSETCLGHIGVRDFRVVTKLPALPDAEPDVAAWVDARVRASLSALQCDRLYGLLLHRPAQLLGARGGELSRALQQTRSVGRVVKVGVSVYDPADLEALQRVMPFDLVQVPCNVFDQRLIASGWLARLNQAGIEVHVRSAFLQGLLLMRPNARPARFARWASVFARYDEWLAETGLTPVQACLRFVNGTAGIDRVVVGVDSRAQLAELVSSADGPFPSPPPSLQSLDPDLVNPARWAQ